MKTSYTVGVESTQSIFGKDCTPNGPLMFAAGFYLTCDEDPRVISQNGLAATHRPHKADCTLKPVQTGIPRHNEDRRFQELNWR
ncbi:MAG: hypothetical protein DHS20C16_28520 [Phycisphaerae bacterium]|nr:MAG: hypothetical protein DHS20C16_28520 [Phycisphaerae bacterium]